MAYGYESLARMQGMQQSALLNSAPATDADKLKETAQEFEALFVKMMLDTMRKNLHKEDRLVEGGMAENIFEDMLYTEYSRLMAKTGDFGIANAIERQYKPSIPAKPFE